MAERLIVVDRKTLTYEGLFSVKELYQMVDKWTFEKQYDKSEKKNMEHVYPTGKQIEIELWPWKKFTDYARIVMKIHFLMTNITEVEIKKDGLKKRINKGKVIMTCSGFLETDYENKWEEKPMLIFLRTLIDKYVYGVHFGRYEGQIIDEINHLFYIVKGYLNVHRL